MNLTTQAAREVIEKIQRDPAEIRHWRQLLIICFDQKAIDTLQTLQSVVAAIEQIWTRAKQKAKEAHDEAVKKQRATGKKDALPSLAVLSIPLTARQKESFSRLAANPESVQAIYRFALHIEEDFALPAAAFPIYERAKTLDTDETQLDQKINEALLRCGSQMKEAGALTTGSVGTLAAIAPESMGVKSPVHHRPSAAALIKRTGRLTVDRSKIQSKPSTEVPWVETQKKLDDMMTRLLTQASALCETAPRPMRLPRSIAPSQWLEFLEGHITLLIGTLEAQDIFVDTSINLEEAPRDDLQTRADLVLALMEEIQAGLASQAPRETKTVPIAAKAAPNPATASLPVMPLEPIFEAIESGALDVAEKSLRTLEENSHPKEQLSEAWFHLGLAFQNNQDSKRALVSYQRARELNPQNLQAWFNGGMIQHEEGMLRDAQACYNQALRIDPEQPKIWCNLGAVQFQLGDFEQSVESLNKAVTLKPDYARAWDNLAGSLCAVENMGDAEVCCRRAIENKPRYADPAFKLGAICFQGNRLEEAENSFRNALDWQPGYALAGHYLAMILARSNRLDEALEVIEKAAAAPGETELPSQAWVEVAFQLYDKGRFEDAIHAYEKAITFTPEKAVVWLDAGVAYHQMGEIAEARKHYEQAVALDPELARAWHNLGAARQEMGDEAGGKQALEEAERLLAGR